MNELYAHITYIDEKNNEQRTQSLEVHSQNVGEKAAQFAANFGLGDLARVMGLLHDKGKEQAEWQKYILGVTNLNKEYAHIKKGPNHAYVGACIAQKQYHQLAPLIAQPIAGHHRGLYDYCDYIEETKREFPKDVFSDKPIPCAFPKFTNLKPNDLHHIIRMLFSCLVDADSLDTEAFMNPEQFKLRGSHTSMEDLLEKMEWHLQTLREKSDESEVNRIRNYVQDQCVKESSSDVGFYSLTVPTGGGKTLASVLWALHHAVKNKLQRIIIAIPYTSIIVQTATTLKNIFGEENVLEHHSNVSYESHRDKDDNDEDELALQMKLATENWDYPIIVTTNVQFFESLFSNRRSNCRKLHNIVKSVVILDEVQTLPLGFYKPIVHTLDTLKRVFGTSILFTTASQPILSGRIECSDSRESFDALPNVHEIIPNDAKLHDKLRRVKLEFIEGTNKYEEIANKISKHHRVLCIVNTRKDAKEIFERLPDEGIRLHLSRMMCPAHVSATIQQIKEALKKGNDVPIRVVATQLIEAGVDIDFPVVYRQEAGLDSILQAAGRCNREGKQNLCTTYVFSLGKEHPLPPGFITQTNNARLNMGKDHDWFSPKAMTNYFHQLHSRISSFDTAHIQELLYKKECEFEEASKQFHLIDDPTTSVIINWDESINLYQQLISQGPSYQIMKKLAQYSVTIRKNDFQLLQKIGAIEEPFENIYAITNPSFYKKDTGLTTDNQWLEETYII